MNLRAIIRLSASAILTCAASSCATFLSSGQLGQDSIVPPPISSSDGNEGTTMLFLGSSLAQGIVFPDDRNDLVQAGALRDWRIGKQMPFVDCHAAASGWLGRVALSDHGYQYTSSVPADLGFYGGTAQTGVALGFEFARDSTFDVGMRGSVAYEDGSYRSFRQSQAGAVGSTVVDLCPSGWSGCIGSDLSASFPIGEEAFMRIGLFVGALLPDLPTAFSETDSSLHETLAQPSLAVRYKRFDFSLAWNIALFNQGVSAVLGYLLP